MLRPTSSRILITSEDIQDLRSRLANRPQHQDRINGVGSTDWSAATTANSTQNRRPQRWQKGLIRPGASRSVHDAFVVFDGHENHDEPLGLAAMRWSREVYETAEVDVQRYNAFETPASTAADLALARQIIDEAANNATNHRVDPRSSEVRQRIDDPVWSAASAPTHTAPVYTDAVQTHNVRLYSTLGDSDFTVPNSQPRISQGILALGHQNQSETHQVYALDGNNDRDSSCQGDSESEGSFSAARERGQLIRPILNDTIELVPSRLLDPLAATFVPTTRLGYADDHGFLQKPSSAGHDFRPHYLRPRSPRSANRGNGQTGSLVPRESRMRMQERQLPRPRGPLRHSEPPRGHHDLLALSGVVENRYPIINLPPGRDVLPSTTPLHEDRELFNRGPSADVQYPRRSYPRHDADLRRPQRSQHLPHAHASLHASYSVPDLIDQSAARAPIIHSRRSSMTWNRNSSGGSVPARSRILKQVAVAEGATTDMEVHSAHYFVQNFEPTQAFYLNNSPLDELTEGLRRFSGAFSDRRSSTSSNPIQPFRGKLLSGSLFYSEEAYSEDPQSTGGSEQQDQELISVGHIDPELHLPPLPPPNYHPLRRSLTPISVVSQQSSPQSAMSLPRALVPGPPPPASPTYMEGTPLPLTSSPARLSPVTSGPTYSVPVSSMPQIELSPSSPVRHFPSEPPTQSPSISSPTTPRQRRVRYPPASTFRSEPRPKPAVPPKFRIYDDCLPAATQPQTPADVRRHPPPASLPHKATSVYNRALSPSPGQRDTYLATQLRPIFEPSTAELTMIPFVSPLQSTRQPRAHSRRRRGNRSPSNDQENEIDLSALAGLEGERIAWMRRSTGSESMVRDQGDAEVLESTPPRMGKLERMARE